MLHLYYIFNFCGLRSKPNDVKLVRFKMSTENQKCWTKDNKSGQEGGRCD